MVTVAGGLVECHGMVGVVWSVAGVGMVGVGYGLEWYSTVVTIGVVGQGGGGGGSVWLNERDV